MSFARISFLLVVAVLTSCQSSSLQSTEPGDSGPGDYSFEVAHQKLKRSYSVHVPTQYQKHQPMPLVLAIHGGGGDAASMKALTEFDATADQAGFIVVYPNGTGKMLRGKTVGSWNGGRCCPPASQEGVDDVGFIDAVITDVSKKFSIDESRVYATGHSNGAIMSYRLACELSEKIAAIAALGAQGVSEPCEPKYPVSIFHFHGTNDRCAPFTGGMCGGCFAKLLRAVGVKVKKDYYWPCNSVEAELELWRKRNEIVEEPKVTYRRGSVTCFSSQASNNGEEVGNEVGAEVTLCVGKGTGHTWPNGTYGKPCAAGLDSPLCKTFRSIVGEKTSDLSANEAIWEFFKRHRRIISSPIIPSQRTS